MTASIETSGLDLGISEEITAAQRRQVIGATLAKNPSRMTSQVARDLGVPEAEVIRAMPAENVKELDAGRWEEVIRSLEGLGNVHVIASNDSVTLECFGQFGNFSTWGGFFNVQTKSLDMHIRQSEVVSIFGVKKPGHMDGVDTLSFQFYNGVGRSAFKVFLTFGGKVAPVEKVKLFETICRQFAIGG